MLSATQPSFQDTDEKEILTQNHCFLQEPFYNFLERRKNMTSLGSDSLCLGGSGFLFLEPSVESVEVESTIQNYPNQHGWIYDGGTGPALINKIQNVAVTGFQYAVGSFYPYQYKKSYDPTIQSMQKRVANGGRQLGGNDIYAFIEGISEKTPMNHISNFYFQGGVNILNYTMEKIKEEIDFATRNFDLNLPICIPVNFGSYGLFERNHIASILIKDNIVDYYDSQGTISKHKKLKDDFTIEDMLNYCRDKFTKDGAVIENRYIHQYDAHNCGVFVCRHIYSKICEGQLIGTLEIEAPSIYDIQNFRKVINKIAYGGRDFDDDSEDDKSVHL